MKGHADFERPALAHAATPAKNPMGRGQWTREPPSDVGRAIAFKATRRGFQGYVRKPRRDSVIFYFCGDSSILPDLELTR